MGKGGVVRFVLPAANGWRMAYKGKALLTLHSVSCGIKGIAPSNIATIVMPVFVVGETTRLYTVVWLVQRSDDSRERRMGNMVLKDQLSQSGSFCVFMYY